MKNKKLAVKVLSAAFALTVLLSGCAGESGTPAECITLAEYSAIQAGMSYQQVQQIVGSPGTILSESGVGQYYTFMVMWYGDPDDVGSNANVMFQNNKVIGKAQYGLR